MNVEHFLVTNKGNPEFKKRVERAQKNCLEQGGPVTKPEIIAGHIILNARDNLQKIATGRTEGTPDEIEAQKVTNMAAIFMGELIRQGEKIGVNKFSVGAFVGRVNQMFAGTDISPLPVPPKHVAVTQDEWKRFVTISREDQTGATFIRDINNLPSSLKKYIVSNSSVGNLYRYINTYGLVDDYQDLARSVIYPDINVGDAPFSTHRVFSKDMKKALKKFLRSYTPRDVKTVEQSETASSRGPVNHEEEFQTDYQERRDAADLAEEFLEEKRRGEAPFPDDTSAIVKAIIGDRPILSDLQQRRLDQEALRVTVSPDTFDRPIGVVNLEVGDRRKDIKRKLETTPSYFGVVHEEHLEQDLAVVDAEKKKLIADVAINLIQTGKKHKWGESARKIAKRGRKELLRKRALQRDKQGAIDLEDPAEAAVTAYRLLNAVGVSRVLTEGEEFDVEKRIVYRLKSSGVNEEAIPGLEEHIHLGYLNGEELWYKEPKTNPNNPDLRKTIEKKAIDVHDAKVRKSTAALPLEGDTRGMELFMDELFSRGRVDVFKEENPDQTVARYVRRIQSLMDPQTVWSVKAGNGSKDALQDTLEAIQTRDRAVEKLIEYLDALGNGDEGRKVRDASQKVPTHDITPHRLRYGSIISRVEEFDQLLRFRTDGSYTDQMNIALDAMRKRAEKLIKEPTEGRHNAG